MKPAATGFLFGIVVGGLLRLLDREASGGSGGSGGSGLPMALAAMLAGIVIVVLVVLVLVLVLLVLLLRFLRPVTAISFGGRAGLARNESRLTGSSRRWWESSALSMPGGGGVGRALERRERPGLRSPTIVCDPILCVGEYGRQSAGAQTLRQTVCAVVMLWKGVPLSVCAQAPFAFVALFILFFGSPNSYTKYFVQMV